LSGSARAVRRGLYYLEFLGFDYALSLSEIFSLYLHQFFLDLKRRNDRGETDEKNGAERTAAVQFQPPAR
jgi:hypothetical protein